MKTTTYILTWVFTVLSAVMVWGCSANGWATRDVPDGGALQKGETVTVVQRDGSSLTGEFQSVEPITELEYAALYEAGTQAPYGERLPKLGQTIQLMTSLSDTKVWQGVFDGFDKDGLFLKELGSTKSEHVYLTSIRLLSDGHGDFLQRMALRKLFLDGRIPLRSAVVLHGEQGDVRIAIDAIKSLTGISDNTKGEGLQHSVSGEQLRQSLANY